MLILLVFNYKLTTYTPIVRVKPKNNKNYLSILHQQGTHVHTVRSKDFTGFDRKLTPLEIIMKGTNDRFLDNRLIADRNVRREKRRTEVIKKKKGPTNMTVFTQGTGCTSKISLKEGKMTRVTLAYIQSLRNLIEEELEL